MIRDRGITDFNDARRSVAGVSRSSTYGYYDAYTIRGYDTAYDNLYLDGLITNRVAGTNYELSRRRKSIRTTSRSAISSIIRLRRCGADWSVIPRFHMEPKVQ